MERAARDMIVYDENGLSFKDIKDGCDVFRRETSNTRRCKVKIVADDLMFHRSVGIDPMFIGSRSNLNVVDTQ